MADPEKTKGRRSLLQASPAASAHRPVVPADPTGARRGGGRLQTVPALPVVHQMHSPHQGTHSPTFHARGRPCSMPIPRLHSMSAILEKNTIKISQIELVWRQAVNSCIC